MPFKDIATSDSLFLRQSPPLDDTAGRTALRRLQESGLGVLIPASSLASSPVPNAIAVYDLPSLPPSGPPSLPAEAARYAITLSGKESEEELQRLKQLNPILLLLCIDPSLSRVHASRRLMEFVVREGLKFSVIHHYVSEVRLSLPPALPPSFPSSFPSSLSPLRVTVAMIITPYIRYEHDCFYSPLPPSLPPLPPSLLFTQPGVSKDHLILRCGSEVGCMLVDGLGDGVMLEAPDQDLSFLRTTSFATLQGSRMRNTKTEFVSCPSCGRTLFDLQVGREGGEGRGGREGGRQGQASILSSHKLTLLPPSLPPSLPPFLPSLQETTAEIQKKTGHLPGVAIAVMGCIVNGREGGREGGRGRSILT